MTGRENPPADALARLAATFARVCAEQEILGTLEPAADRPGQLELTLPEQEDADSTLLLRLFREEMTKTGLELDDLLGGRLGGGDAAAQVAAAETALGTALGRLRILLIEYNSYLSGHLHWPFTTGEATLRERGLAAYRYPARAPVDIVSADDHMRITFHPADLGKVTSSGFYVPTRVRGDFTATLEYRLGAWEPGAHSVCLALFAQDEPSQLRYYSQRRTAGERDHEVMANFNNVVLTEPIPVAGKSGSEGAFRLERRGNVITSWHREGEKWTVLGEHRGDPTHDVIFGSKIWSSHRAGTLDARLFGLEIGGELPADQIPAVPIRPDPRQAG